MNNMSNLNFTESASKPMIENYASPLASDLYVIELWLAQIGSRDFILAFVVISFVLCSTFIGFLKDSSKERYPWRRPSTYPMSVPVIGHLLMMAWDSSKFLSAVVSVYLRYMNDLRDLC